MIKLNLRRKAEVHAELVALVLLLHLPPLAIGLQIAPSAAFSDLELASVLPEAVFNSYLRARMELLESQVDLGCRV